MKKQNLILLMGSLLLLNNALTFGQEPIDSNRQENDYYSVLGMTFNRKTFRDFATSPLFYNGVGSDFQAGWLRRSKASERMFDIGLGVNAFFARVPTSDFLQSGSTAFMLQLNSTYSQLFEIGKISTDKNNIKVGGLIHLTQNIRSNFGLFNNGLGLENSTNIMASGQIIRDISRNAPKELNLLVFKPTLKPVKRDLRFQLNAGILNFNYRPSYAYSYEGEIIGMETQPISWVLSSYKWSLNGWRFNTEIEFIKYLPNGNARSWSYVWDALQMPGRHENFQMASHQIRYRIFFQTKKR